MTFVNPVRTDYSRNVDIGQSAELAFASALRRWFGSGRGTSEFIRIDSQICDSHSIDFRTHVTWSDDPHYGVSIDWQVKTVDSAIVPPTIRITRNDAQRLLYNKNPTFIVCGVRGADSPHLDSHTGYEWYAIDLRLFLQAKYKLGSSRFRDLPADISIRFPLANRLNCCLASIVWGALWFREITNAVRDREKLIHANRSFLGHLEGSLPLSQADLHLLRGICEKEMLHPSFPNSLLNANAIFGPTYIASWVMTEHANHPNTDYVNFGTEGLSPAFNLWLFAKSHRFYLRRVYEFYKHRKASAKFVMPIAWDLQQLPAHFRCAYVNIAKVMRRYGIKIMIDRRLISERGDAIMSYDRSSFAGKNATLNSIIDTHDVFEIKPVRGKTKVADVYASLRPELWRDYQVDATEMMCALPRREFTLVGAPQFLLPPPDAWFDLPIELWTPEGALKTHSSSKRLFGW